MKLFVPTWPDEQTKLLEKFFEEGGSASVISNRLGEHGYKVTRNSVIGKLYRMGLSGNKKTGKDKPAPQRIKNTVISPGLPAGRIVPKLRRKVIVPRRNGAHHNGGNMASPPNPVKHVLLRESKDGECRAIIGYRNGILADAVCCGEKTIWKMIRYKMVQSPWCEYHNKIYVQEDKR